MAPHSTWTLLLAAELARAAGRAGVVTLGCPLRAVGEQPALALVLPPLGSLPIAVSRLLLAVFRDASPAAYIAAGSLAAANVPDTGVVDAEAAMIERLWAPAAGHYRRRSLLWPGDSVGLAALPHVGLVLPPGPLDR